MVTGSLVKASNWLSRRRGVRVPAANLLLLFPHCLQWSKCPHRIVNNLENCKRCGKCGVKGLLELAEKLGVQIAVASGGRQAVTRVKRPDVHAVVAVACEKELCLGIMATMPKPVIGVVNLRPHGPCVDTAVDLAKAEAALREFLDDTTKPESAQQAGHGEKR